VSEISSPYQLGELTTDERDQPAYRLSSSYQLRASAAAAEQLERAGCRLAMVLNQAFSGDPVGVGAASMDVH